MTKNNQTIHDKMEALRQLIAWFDGDDFSLEASIEKFKEAQTLADEIEKELAALKNDIAVVKQSFES